MYILFWNVSFRPFEVLLFPISAQIVLKLIIYFLPLFGNNELELELAFGHCFDINEHEIEIDL